jgi:peroxiredoxin
MTDPLALPDDLPAPTDDGAAAHLPGTALPSIALPSTDGCTPEACSFRDEIGQFTGRGVRVHGLSVQDTDYQREAVERLHLPYTLLSDAALELTRALDLPTFEVEGQTLLRRLTLLLRDGRIDDVVYPVFPPDRGAELALEKLG